MVNTIDKCLSPVMVQNVAYKIILLILCRIEDNERYWIKIKREKGREWGLD